MEQFGNTAGSVVVWKRRLLWLRLVLIDYDLNQGMKELSVRKEIPCFTFYHCLHIAIFSVTNQLSPERTIYFLWTEIVLVLSHPELLCLLRPLSQTSLLFFLSPSVPGFTFFISPHLNPSLCLSNSLYLFCRHLLRFTFPPSPLAAPVCWSSQLGPSGSVWGGHDPVPDVFYPINTPLLLGTCQWWNSAAKDWIWKLTIKLHSINKLQCIRENKEFYVFCFYCCNFQKWKFNGGNIYLSTFHKSSPRITRDSNCNLNYKWTNLQSEEPSINQQIHKTRFLQSSTWIRPQWFTGCGSDWSENSTKTGTVSLSRREPVTADSAASTSSHTRHFTWQIRAWDLSFTLFFLFHPVLSSSPWISPHVCRGRDGGGTGGGRGGHVVAVKGLGMNPQCKHTELVSVSLCAAAVWSRLLPSDSSVRPEADRELHLLPFSSVSTGIIHIF